MFFLYLYYFIFRRLAFFLFAINSLYFFFDNFFSVVTGYLLLLSFTSLKFLLLNIRDKLLYFICVCYLFSIWGYCYGLDGLFLIFLITELTVFLLLVMSYTYIYSNLSFFNKTPNYLVPLLLVLTFLLLPHYNLMFSLSFNDIHSYLYQIVSSDFFFIFYFLFNSNGLVTVLLTLIIGLYSLFFILVYFSLKSVKFSLFNRNLNLSLLRKQSILKQYKGLSSLFIFQK